MVKPLVNRICFVFRHCWQWRLKYNHVVEARCVKPASLLVSNSRSYRCPSACLWATKNLCMK